MSSEERKRYEKFVINAVRDRDVIETAQREGEEAAMKKMEPVFREIEEKNRALEASARAMLQAGMSAAEVGKITGLSVEELQKLTGN